MTTILLDHHLEGYADLLLGSMASEGWLEFGLFRLTTLAELGLSFTSSDREIWQRVQEQRLLLLTGNRNMDGEDSLEQTIRDSNQTDSVPVNTIGDIERLIEKTYREQCVTKLAEIAIDLENYLSVGRLYIP